MTLMTALSAVFLLLTTIAPSTAYSAPRSTSAESSLKKAVREATDSEIAAVVIAAGEVDRSAGSLALQKSSHPEVKSFASRILSNQSLFRSTLDEWAKKSRLSPEENIYSLILRQGGLGAVERLKKLEGDAFDREYASAEADYQQKVLRALDQVLLPNCRSGSLKRLLVQARPKVAMNAENAKALRDRLVAHK